jgi:CRP/FNR family transcriptional regulator
VSTIKNLHVHSTATQNHLNSSMASSLNCYTRKHCVACKLGDTHLSQFERLGKRRVLRKGEQLFRQGDTFQSLFVVQSGSVKSSVVGDDGEEQITGFHFPGDLLSVDGMDSGLQTYSAEALETTSICEFVFRDFERISDSMPDLKSQFFKAMGKELSREKKRMLVLGRMRAEQRLATFILDTSRELRSRGQANDSLTFSMTRQDIANYLGLAVETVSRLLSQFAATDLIRVQRRCLEVLDRSNLENLAQGFQPSAQLIARSA